MFLAPFCCIFLLNQDMPFFGICDSEVKISKQTHFIFERTPVTNLCFRDIIYQFFPSWCLAWISSLLSYSAAQYFWDSKYLNKTPRLCLFMFFIICIRKILSEKNVCRLITSAISCKIMNICSSAKLNPRKKSKFYCLRNWILSKVNQLKVYFLSQETKKSAKMFLSLEIYYLQVYYHNCFNWQISKLLIFHYDAREKFW